MTKYFSLRPTYHLKSLISFLWGEVGGMRLCMEHVHLFEMPSVLPAHFTKRLAKESVAILKVYYERLSIHC